MVEALNNGKIRCYSLNFAPIRLLDIDLIFFAKINRSTTDQVAFCKFRKVYSLVIKGWLAEIDGLLDMFSQIEALKLNSLSVSELDLRSKNIQRLEFRSVDLSEELNLPLNLDFFGNLLTT